MKRPDIWQEIHLTHAITQTAVTRFSPQQSRLDPRQVHVGFVLDKMALEEDFLKELQSSPAVSITPPILHTHSLIYHQYNIITATDCH
jgi:cyanate lyase